jgi:aspartate kinase
MAPDHPGTLIAPTRERGAAPVASIASKKGIFLVNIVSARMLGQSGFMATVFEAFKRHDVAVDLIATSEVSVSVSVDREEGLKDVVAELGAAGTVTVEEGNALVAVIGERMQDAAGLGGRVFGALGQEGIPIRAISYGATKTNLQIVVPQDKTAAAVKTLHRVLFPE